MADKHKAQDDGKEHGHGFNYIKADNCLHSTAHGIQPLQKHHNKHRYPERNARGARQKQLKRSYHKEQPHRRTKHLGDKEKPRPGLMGTHAKPLVKVLVDRHHAKAEIQRRKHKSNDKVAQEEAYAHLEISKTDVPHHPGHGYKRDPGQAGANHGNGNLPPGGGPGGVEILIPGHSDCSYVSGR